MTSTPTQIQPFVFNGQRFPVEIVINIFHIAAENFKETCLSLCLVASWTRELTLPHMYKMVMTDQPGSTKCFLNAISRRSSIGRIVKSLCIYEELGPGAERPSTEYISLCCPNLRDIIARSPSIRLLEMQNVNRIGIIAQQNLPLGFAASMMNYVILPSLRQAHLHQFLIIYQNDRDLERMLENLKQARAQTNKLTWLALNDEDGRSLRVMWEGHHPQGDSIWEIAEARTRAVLDTLGTTEIEDSKAHCAPGGTAPRRSSTLGTPVSTPTPSRSPIRQFSTPP